MAFGDFTPSVWPRLLANLRDMTTDDRVTQRHTLMPDFGVLDLVKGKIETATFTSVRPNDRKCEDFDVAWLEESDTKATLNTNQSTMHRAKCSISGEELQSNKKTYSLKKSVDYTVKIADEDCGNMFDAESKVALSLLQGQKKLVQRLCEALPALIAGYAAANKANGIAFNGQIGTPDGSDPVTLIQTSDLTGDKTIPYLAMMAKLNKLQDPYLLDGGMFYFDQFKSAVEAGTYAGSKYWALSKYELDIVNMMDAGFLNSAFVMDKGSLALPIVSFFPPLGEDNEVVSDKYWYSIPIAGLTLNGKPVMIDVTYTKKEEQIGSTGRCQLIHTFHMELKFDLWQAPRYASDTVSGILQFEQQAA